jgi:hypothetical protein
VKRTLIAAGVVSLVLAGTGCGAPSHTVSSALPTTVPAPPVITVTTPPTIATPVTITTLPPINYGAKYLAIVAPEDVAIIADQKIPTLSTAQITALVTDINAANAKLIVTTWPAKAAIDVRSLVADTAQLAAALTNGYSDGITTTDEVAATAAAEVRADLGLPTNLTG